ncbi:MAG: pyruvate carboxylase subunit B [Archaeoglobaceae archaeon]|nr:pyruvate carboxylase subunit B [Archaeoglobaceae archaeon]HDD36079.1 pyruvate carboxylase subunit B [Archaeoglobus veneficus]
MDLKKEILEMMKKFFDEIMERDDITYEKIQWELDYLIYPNIGAYLASGDISREEGVEIFKYCEERLRELKEKLKHV